jgi:lysyl-tRNA synthetase class 2
MPGLDLHVDAIAAEGGFLVTSPEHHMKRLLVGGMPRIFQLCHASRAGELGAMHEPEFAMLEWYRAFSGQDAVIADTEALVRRVAVALSGKPEIVLPSGRRIALGAAFERITVREAFRRWAGVRDATRLADDRFFELLVSAVEPALAALSRPVFLCEYPLAHASLARKKPGDPRVAERFELYLGGVELCNGFGELTDAREQRRRFERDRAARRRLHRPIYELDEKLLAALVEGMPPSGGNALGVDRLIALARGRAEIAAVMPFPAARL